MLGLLEGITQGTAFVDLSDSEVYECIVAVDHDADTGPNRIARLPEFEDGSDPRWKLLSHAPDLARKYAAALGEVERLREALEAVGKAHESGSILATGAPGFGVLMKARAALASAPEERP